MQHRSYQPAETEPENLRKLEEGKIDIIIGTHRLLGSDIKFKDLGLLILDEEQKFGVAAKEKLKKLKLNVDTLTLTATPSPRTLQFSLMGARDLSIINTPPPNRHPIITELHTFNEEIIREFSMRFQGGQVFSSITGAEHCGNRSPGEEAMPVCQDRYCAWPDGRNKARKDHA
jgi:transcription-repair coupling factor (superfamily II helicase)